MAAHHCQGCRETAPSQRWAPTGALKEDPCKEGASVLLGVMLRFGLCVGDGNRSRVSEKRTTNFFYPQ